MANPIPDRNEIIWLNFEPPRGKEIGKYRPALVLSSRAYNEQTGLLICCPISSSIRGIQLDKDIVHAFLGMGHLYCQKCAQ